MDRKDIIAEAHSYHDEITRRYYIERDLDKADFDREHFNYQVELEEKLAYYGELPENRNLAITYDIIEGTPEERAKLGKT